MDDFAKTAPWMGAGLALLVVGTWVLRTAVVLHNKKIAEGEEQQIAVPSWYYAACIVFLTLLTDALLGGGLLTALGENHAVHALALAVALRLLLHAAVLSWLLSARFRAAMIIQVFEIGIALTLAPLIGSVVLVLLAG